jgi:hypothetical protein
VFFIVASLVWTLSIPIPCTLFGYTTDDCDAANNSVNRWEPQEACRRGGRDRHGVLQAGRAPAHHPVEKVR